MKLTTALLFCLACCLPLQAEVFENVTYLPKERLERLTIVTPDGPGPFPCVLLVPGGGWGDLVGMGGHTKTNAPWLAKHGFVAVVVEYHVNSVTEGPLAGQFAIPHALADLQTAIRFMRANASQFKVDVDHIGAIGFSAGGWSSTIVGYAQKGFRYEVKGKGSAWIADNKDLPHADQSWALQAIVLSSGNRDMKILTRNAEHTKVIPTLLIAGEKEYKSFSAKSKDNLDALFAKAKVEFAHAAVVGGKHAPPVAPSKRNKNSKVRMADGSEHNTEDFVLNFLKRHLK